MDLFEPIRARHRDDARPLAARMRPRSLAEYAGQGHILGPGMLLPRMIRAGRLASVILHGPPGCGKTTLAHVIAAETKARFVPLNAVETGVKEVREELAAARERLDDGRGKTLLFVDEIHRFSRGQQDVLLPDVENGVVTLIGATTQNPFFALTAPLLSRSQLFTLEPLGRDDVKRVLRQALADPERGFGGVPVTLTPEAEAFFAEVCDGDARRALTALEIGVKSAESFPLTFDLPLAQECIQRKVMEFDPTGDSHYDVASAFIKSMRGSDVQAALYWLARMLESGEEPRFIARRLVIFASEDVGNADPRGLLIAQAAWDAVERVGLPECQLNLSHAVCFLATAPKSNAATVAIGEARADVRNGRTLPVPKHLRDSHYGGAKERLGHGAGYQYAHDFAGGWVDQEYVPAEGLNYYRPTGRGGEAEVARRMEEIARRRAEGRG